MKTTTDIAFSMHIMFVSYLVVTSGPLESPSCYESLVNGIAQWSVRYCVGREKSIGALEASHIAFTLEYPAGKPAQGSLTFQSCSVDLGRRTRLGALRLP